MSRHFDAIIIGTGQAGPSLAARFASAGMAVAIIERNKFGGTCVNTGYTDKEASLPFDGRCVWLKRTQRAALQH